MNKSTAGWVTFIVALGMMCGLVSSDVGKLKDWGEATNPAFISVLMAHFGTVTLAFVGGKLIPENRNGSERTRVSDKKVSEEDK